MNKKEQKRLNAVLDNGFELLKKGKVAEAESIFLANSNKQRLPSSLFVKQQYGLARVRIEQGETNYDEAEYILRNLIDEKRNYSAPYNTLGRLLEKRNDFAGAREIFQRGLESCPKNKQVFIELIQANRTLELETTEGSITSSNKLDALGTDAPVYTPLKDKDMESEASLLAVQSDANYQTKIHSQLKPF